MELPPLTELSQSVNWNLAYRGSLVAPVNENGATTDSIGTVNVTLNSHAAVVIAINENASPHWYLACWCSVIAPKINIGSTSQINNSVELFSLRIPLFKPKLITILEYNLKPYILQFKFPYWHTAMLLEVWWYDEVEINPHLELSKSIKEDLSRIEQKIDNL